MSTERSRGGCRRAAAATLGVLYPALVGAALGAGGFFLFVVSAAFASVPGAALLSFLARVFPAFYAVTLSASLLAAVLAALAGRSSGALLAGLAAALQAFGWAYLLPAVHRALGTAAFVRLHGVALGVSLVAACILLAALAVEVARPSRKPQ